jgi:Leucine-rich repeat (LRR) protein
MELTFYYNNSNNENKIKLSHDCPFRNEVFNALINSCYYDKITYLTISVNWYNKNIHKFIKLPNSLKLLSCKKCNLDSLNKLLNKLPDSLEYLDCSYNNLTSLPKLPNSLQKLYCQFNILTMIPELPRTLLTLYCDVNNFIRKRKYKYLIKIICM